MKRPKGSGGWRGGYLADRYGFLEGIENTLRDDPIGLRDDPIGLRDDAAGLVAGGSGLVVKGTGVHINAARGSRPRLRSRAPLR